MNSKNVIGLNVKFLRKQKNYTQKEFLAKLDLLGLHLDEPKLSRIENQQRPVFDYEVLIIAAALEIPIEYLFKQNKL